MPRRGIFRLLSILLTFVLIGAMAPAATAEPTGAVQNERSSHLDPWLLTGSHGTDADESDTGRDTHTAPDSEPDGQRAIPAEESRSSATVWDGLPVGPDGLWQQGSPADLAPSAPGVPSEVDDALAQDGSAEVIIELRDALTPAQLESIATAAAVQARGEHAGAAVLDPQVQAQVRAARGEAVVTALEEHMADERQALITLVDGDGSSADTSPVLDLWVINAVSAVVDAETAAAVAQRPEVASIRLAQTLELPEISSEPLLPTWGLEAVQAPQTWGEYGYRGDGITVAVLDSGIDAAHPALAGSYRGRDGDHASSWFVVTGENYPTPGDGHGHGTHVTGSITGGAPGEVIGVAPEAEYIGVKIFNDNGGASEAGILAGMQWVLAPGGDPAMAPDIANNSWGNSAGNVTTYWDAVAAWRAAGIVPIFANGNAGPLPQSAGSPADHPHSFAVGATDQNDAIASFSSRGPVFWDGVEHIKPQVSAPGHQVRSAWPTALGEDYRTISGTSMATPHVSGVAALVLSANPGLAVHDIEDILEQTARVESHMGRVPNNSFGHGIVDAFQATTRASHSGLVSGTVTGPDGPVAAHISATTADAQTSSDPQTGAYELWLPEGDHEIEVSAYGFATDVVQVEVSAGEITQADVVLSAVATATLSGQVVTEAGDPIASAQVRLVDADPLTWTDAGGAFSLEVAQGQHRVRVLADGYRPWQQSVDITTDQTLEVTLLPLAGVAQQGWPELKANAAGTGLGSSALDASGLALDWSTTVATTSFSSPIISADSIYITSQGGTLNALDRDTGQVRWTAPTGGT